MRRKRRSSRRGWTGFLRSRVMRRRLIALLSIVVIALLLLWLGSYLYDYQIEYYEPRDVERE